MFRSISRAEARREALLAAYVFEKICLDLAAELGDGPVMMPTVRKMEAKYRTALNVAMEKAIAGAPAQEQWEQLEGLDLEATLWLENFLKSYPATLIVISHERDLLNNVVDTILHLEQGKISLYSGNYDGFEKQRAERAAQLVAIKTPIGRTQWNVTRRCI